MSRAFFNANNKVGDTWSLQTNSPSGTTFSPSIGSISALWDLGDGSSYRRNPNYTYSDSGATKTATIRGRRNFTKSITTFEADFDNIVGHLDFSGWDNLGNANPFIFNIVYIHNNPELTGVTHTESVYDIKNYRIYNCDITGHLDLSMVRVKDSFLAFGNPNLTGISHSSTTEVMSFYSVSDCDITGNHDVSMFTLGGVFEVDGNTNLTGVTHSYSNETFTKYDAFGCSLIGVYDMTMFPQLGGDVNLYSNPNLTNIIHTASTNQIDYNVSNTGLVHLDVSMLSGIGGTSSGKFWAYLCPNLTAITHTASTNVLNSYSVYSCDLTGNHDVSMFSNMSGTFNAQLNPNLTGITHAVSTGFTNYNAYQCDLTGTHDVSMIHDMGNFSVYLNSNLSGIIHTDSTVAGNYIAWSCNLTGLHDMSMLSGRTQYIRVHDNPGMLSIALGPTSGTFANTGVGSTRKAISMNGCGLGYVDFWPLSAATMNTGATNGVSIMLQGNGMQVGDVNHILDDLDNISTLNPSGWGGSVVLDISGTNAAPDGSAGGFNGTGATVSLTSKGWTVTTS